VPLLHPRLDEGFQALVQIENAGLNAVKSSLLTGHQQPSRVIAA
jgi:hypothetical protein